MARVPDHAILYLGEMQKVTVEHGDVFVLHCEHNISPETAEKMRASFPECFPGSKLLVVDGGMRLVVLKRDEIES